MLKRLFQLFWAGETLLILLGTTLWSLTMVKSGWVYPFGMGFWGPNGHDGIWHLSLIESLAKGSWQMPIFSGELLRNYHFGFDVILAFLSRITRLPSYTLYFQIIPPALAFFIGLLTYKLVFVWRKSKKEAFWATFFVYFGGSWGWLVDLVKEGGLGGESMFWAQQSISTLINPPYALSLVLIVLGLILLKKLKDKFSFGLFVLSILVFGILIQIKAYAGVLSLFGLLIAGIYEFIGEKKTTILKVFGGSLVVSALIFLPFNKFSESFFIFKPFWFLETMMLPDRVGWERFYSAMTNYKLAGNWLKGIPAYLIAFVIFWLGNLGTRVIKEVLVIRWIRDIKKLSFIEVFMGTIIISGVIAPLFFIQKGTSWNTIQFLYYSLFFSGILAGLVLGSWLEEKRASLIAVIIVLLTFPTTIATLKHYLPQRPPAMVSNAELEALGFLKEQPQGVVLTYPFDKDKAREAESNPPRPLYLYESTAYVSAFSKKPVFLEDEVNLDITLYDWEERRSEILSFLSQKDDKKKKEFLSKYSVDYIYWVKTQEPDPRKVYPLEKIFENQEVAIFLVR